jgi:hypothetical protein
MANDLIEKALEAEIGDVSRSFPLISILDHPPGAN